MEKELIQKFLEAFAVGDSFGKATEYCSRTEIAEAYSSITEIFPPSESLSHKDILHGHVTDDTEQVVYLIREYSDKGRVDSYDTAMCLLKWFKETDAIKYMGPSSLRALTYIEDGGDIEKAGINGTTCGGIMRSPAAFLFSNDENAVENTVRCLKPTHNTALAMEAAIAYTSALMEASKDGSSVSTIIKKAIDGSLIGYGYGNRERTNGVGPSMSSRLLFLQKVIPLLKNDEELKVLLYDVLGTTLSSIDCASAAFAIFIYTDGDVLRTIQLATETGGDTDTIACLAAGLSALYSKGHNIPQHMVKLVAESNNIDFSYLADLVVNYQEEHK